MNGDFFLTNWSLMGMRWLFENIAMQSIILTILISTIVIRLLTIFSDIKSRKSSIKMQAVQPELDKIRKKYANNPQKLQQAQSKYMRDNGVSMWGGCLPMLVTMPLFFCFIAAFRFWGYEQQVKLLLELETTGGATKMFDTFRFLWVTNIWQPDVGHVPVMMSAESFLAIPGLNNLMFFNENPQSYMLFRQLFPIGDGGGVSAVAIENYNRLVAPILQQYEGYNNGWYLLPLLVAGTTFLSTWMMQHKQPKSDSTSGANKTMMYMMPLMMAFFCLSSNAAFSIYWTISSALGILTNYFINRHFDKEREMKQLEANKP